MNIEMYRVEALLGNEVVSVTSNWAWDGNGAISGMDRVFEAKGIKFDGIRARIARNIYDATLIDGDN